jgi:hypothetical protein
MVNRDLPRAWALGKSFAEGQRGTRQRKVGRHGAGLFTANLPSAGPAGTRQIRFYFLKKNCRVSHLWALGKSIFFIFFKNNLPSAMTQTLGKSVILFKKMFAECHGLGTRQID